MKPRTYLASAALGALILSGCDRSSDSPLVPMDPPKDAVSRTELQPLWPVPDFNLTERTGNAVALADLKGKVWIVDFFYTSCPGPCPMMTSRLSDLQKALGAESDVRLVSISSDPIKDTPDVLKQYAERFHASDRWLFLTGDKAKIYQLANDGFKLNLVETPEAAEPITHSTKLVLVDRSGTVRGLYEGVGKDESSRIVADVRRLLNEKP